MNNWGQLAVFDLETTGVDVETARIVSACVAVLAADGRVIDRWDWLADPGVEIPEGAAAVHGITTERARAEGRTAQLVAAEITQTLRVLFALGIPLVVYNAPYDLTLLDRECRRHQLGALEVFSPVIDPLVIDKAVDRYRKGKRTLVATAERYRVTLDDAHDAGSDAIAAGRVAHALGGAYPDELDIPLADLHGRQEIWYAEQAASFQDYIRSVKGDESYVADTAWPMRAAGPLTSLVDTQPIPVQAPRPSLTVPTLDLGTGRLVPPPAAPASSRHAYPAPPEPPAPLPVVSPDEVPLRLRQVALGNMRIGEVNIAQLNVAQLNVAQLNVAQFNVAQFNFGQLNVAQLNVGQLDIEPVDAGSVPASTAAASVPIPMFEDLLPISGSAPPPARPPRRPSVLRIAAGIITDPSGRTLLVRKHGSTAFMQAGGKIEAGESALDALSRELREEIGHEPDLDRTEYLGSFRAIAANETDTVIRAEVFALSVAQEAAGQLHASGEIEELLWLEPGGAATIELAPLTRDTILPLWAERRSALF